MKRQGSDTVPVVRVTVTTPSSSGTRRRLQRIAAELPELVEEEHPAMGPGDLAGPRRRAASDQGSPGNRVMRRPERPPYPRPAVLPADAGDPGHLDRLVRAQRREQRRQPVQRQRLAAARRADQQEAVGARGGDLQAAAQSRMAAQILQVRQIVIGGIRAARGRDRRDRALGQLVQLGDVVDRHHLEPADQRRLGGVPGGDRDAAQSPPPRPLGHGQRARDRPDRAIEGELPGEGVAVEDRSAEAARTRPAPRWRSRDRNPDPPCAGRRARGWR